MPSDLAYQVVPGGSDPIIHITVLLINLTMTSIELVTSLNCYRSRIPNQCGGEPCIIELMSFFLPNGNAKPL